MFRQTLIKLTFLNSLVFIVLISALGSVIYFYTENKLYRDVNQSLHESIEHFQKQPEGPGEIRGDDGGPIPKFIRRDPRILTLIWDENNQLLLEQNRDSEIFQDNEKLIRPKTLNTLKDVDVEDFSFRYIAFEVDHPQLGKITVQFIRNVNSEQKLLERLLLIMLIGMGVGIICAVASGYFLAGKALVPIKKAWQKQTEFVSDASHELRTPLAVIQAKTDLLFRSPAATIKDKILDVSTISNESRRLSKLVTNLLTLARSDSDQIEVKKETFHLNELLKEIHQQYEEIVMYQEKSLRIEAAEPVTFFGDKARIHQLIVILLDNAMKYTMEGGEILLSCGHTHSSIFLKVKDNGIGIPEMDIPKIFDRFYQSDKARTAAEGTGLGLSIAKWIIEKHHGKTKIQSTLGKGTTIEITFPKTPKN
ncbi:HAMP domain-containing histidine kinase [Bacillus sp. ISL-40]|uniref:sensor histidine kinase n=1 Tax=unclassified Bacillus (in: firmicutes) TaxID=185979 RepID=UPI001BE74406|nr:MULTISPECIES: HAMP domain-containing sensor histidine kinase [unclassified Bacillus (in: firmicutes)]MBT2696717.1 HAMP domain-containing histidine kinase [Bacillus sp. ISL-40]MBT2721280.1 HAMP domain-containing histidine kinase [Bacillus sp. ISL-46]MBT2740034.1 HAMP domain-containing histidine kinase [Bacillus sp. ISL-77]